MLPVATTIPRPTSLSLFLEHAARRDVPEQEEQARPMRQQNGGQRNIEHDLGKNRAGHENKGRRQTRRQTVSKSHYEPACQSGNRGEQQADGSDTFGRKKRSV